MRMHPVVALLTLGLAVIAAFPTSERIVGGSFTNIGQYPMAASLLYSRTGAGTFSQLCGGSILNNRAILSAAHCFVGDPANRWRFRVGSINANSGGVVHNTNSIIIHPSYNARITDNDVAVLRSANTFSFNNNVRAGSIAGANYNLGDNQVVWAIGWGRISFVGPWSEQLRHVQIWTINQTVCRQRYSELGRVITDNMLCSGWLDVGGRDQCQGDCGGPLFHNGVIVGVYSWGQECARPRFPGVNARVSRFTNWIRDNA